MYVWMINDRRQRGSVDSKGGGQVRALHVVFGWWSLFVGPFSRVPFDPTVGLRQDTR